MIKVRIGDVEKDSQDVNEGWISQQLNRQRRNHQPVCVQVTIDEPPLDMVLSTPGCSSAGGSRAPNDQERRIFDLWAKRRLNEPDFTGGNLIAFLRQIS